MAENELTPNQFRRLFPKASASTARRNGVEDNNLSQDAEHKLVVQHDMVREIQSTKVNSGKVLISITSYRMRLLDEDGQVEKYFVDCLRYCGIICGDSPEQASIPRPRQTKVNSKEEERIEIEITYL